MTLSVDPSLPADEAEPAGQFEVHDAGVLAHARDLIDSLPSLRLVQQEVVNAVRRNEIWRGEECLNLLAPEAPTSPVVRSLLSSEIGTRAAEGHIGAVQRWFVGTRYIDEVEALCVELLKKAFCSNYADHRLIASMLGNLTVYTALTRPGDTIMSIPQPTGGHSANREIGPAGIRGLRIVDVPLDPVTLDVDLDEFARIARAERPKLVALGASMTLFPFPIREISEIIAPWGGRVFFDGAHQLGLIGGGQFQDPLREGAAVMTGSAGKTFSGPQSGIIVWNDPELTAPIADTIFPVIAATHQVNRVAALAAATAEFLAFGREYMAAIVANAQTLAQALHDRGIAVLGADRGFTRTHQVILDVRRFGNGMDVARRLEAANIITNKNLIPSDRPEDWDRPHGLRIGTTEVTRYGMGAEQMATIADLIVDVLEERRPVSAVKQDVTDLRRAHPSLHYCFPAD
ncbi:MAG: aminotransferase class I/II-fold pyridoxal phosphate-dependent enzyme [Acidipropionibacterium sp.]|jgi:glycine hydroxymethyltransferase|nr:aminotransferase class I/II-fold pyridoxal phosphate-dependent enzyme [Acidipropionibacterium sp.]